MAITVTTREPAMTDAAGTGSPAELSPPPRAPRASFEAARRVVESVIIAVVTSTGLYLVGSVYTDAYYGRMSIEASALDLPPPFIALQAVHVIQSLLQFPLTLLLLFLVYRVVTSRVSRVRSWTDHLQQRFGRLTLLVANAFIIMPLVLPVFTEGVDPARIQTSSVRSEVASVMPLVALALVAYVLWLSFGLRELLLVQLQERQLLPIGLLFALYLLDALLSTAHDAAADAERMMIGASNTSVAVTFTMASGVAPLPSPDLLLVTIRNGHYFVVERQPDPPSRTPVAYAIPFRAVDDVRMQRVQPAALTDERLVTVEFGTPAAP